MGKPQHISKKVSPFYVWTWGSFMVVACILIAIIFVRQGLQNLEFINFFLAIFCLVAAGVFGYMIRTSLVLTFEIKEVENGIIAYDIYDKAKFVHYDEIRSIRINNRNNRNWFIEYFDKNTKVFRNLYLIIDLSGLGDLLENILANSQNLEGISIDDYTELWFKGKPVWGKPPDWTIINTAKRRAEENRKKAQSSAPQASPAASAPPLAGGAPVRAEGDTTPPPL